MKCLTLTLSALAICSYTSAQSLNYPILWWTENQFSAPAETTTSSTNFDAIMALKADAANSDLIVLLNNGLST